MQSILLLDLAKREETNPKLLRLVFCPFSGMMETCPWRNPVINITSVIFPEDGLFLLDYLILHFLILISKVKIAFRVLGCLCWSELTVPLRHSLECFKV